MVEAGADMAGVKKVVFQAGSSSSAAIHIDGLADLLRYLQTGDAKNAAALKKAIRAAGAPVLASAKGRASRIAASSDFCGSLSIRKQAHGIALVSNDAAAGVLEFARTGAKTRTAKGTSLAQARLRLHSGVGVPRGQNPRAMVPAVNDNIDRVLVSIKDALEAVAAGELR